MTSSTSEKVRENRVRRMADRQGLRLHKSRRRDPLAIDFGKYWLIDSRSDGVVLGGDDGADLEEIEAALSKGLR